MTPRAERRAIVALFAVFALLVQALLPAMASATPRPGEIICVAHGVQTAPSDSGPGKAQPMRGCDHCACPAAFAASPPVAAIVPERIGYPASPGPVVVAAAPTPGRGLAAPPPPSQGPPHFTS